MCSVPIAYSTPVFCTPNVAHFKCHLWLIFWHSCDWKNTAHLLLQLVHRNCCTLVTVLSHTCTVPGPSSGHPVQLLHRPAECCHFYGIPDPDILQVCYCTALFQGSAPAGASKAAHLPTPGCDATPGLSCIGRTGGHQDEWWWIHSCWPELKC